MFDQTIGGNMKILSALVVILVTSSAFAASELPVLVCKSKEKVNGYTEVDTFEYAYYKAYVKSATQLEKAQVTGAWESDVRDLTADQDAGNKFERTRFQTLEDLFRWFNILLPENFADRTGKFDGAMQIYYEESHTPDYVDMTCFIKK